METNFQNQIIENPKLELLDDSISYLKGAIKWAKFLAILGFVFIGMMVVAGLIVTVVFLIIGDSMFDTPSPFPFALIGLIYLIFGAIYFFPILYLFRFSNKINNAFRTKNSNDLSLAFKNLKSLYRFIGIMTIAVFCLYILIVIVFMIIGISGILN